MWLLDFWNVDGGVSESTNYLIEKSGCMYVPITFLLDNAIYFGSLKSDHRLRFNVAGIQSFDICVQMLAVANVLMVGCNLVDMYVLQFHF